MANEINNGAGYEYGLPPKVSYPMYGDGSTPSPADIDITASASVDDTTGTPAVTVEKTTQDTATNFSFKFSGLKGEKGADGAQGPQGEKGDTGAAGAAGPDYNAVVATSITNENGVYTVKNAMHDGTEQDVGTIEVPTGEKGIVEVKDTVVENNDAGYDFHTITETEDGGTENEVGKFYIAQSQILSPYYPTSMGSVSTPTSYGVTTIGQDGKTSRKYLGRVGITVTDMRIPDYEEGKQLVLVVGLGSTTGYWVPLLTFSDYTRYSTGMILCAITLPLVRTLNKNVDVDAALLTKDVIAVVTTEDTSPIVRATEILRTPASVSSNIYATHITPRLRFV